MAPGVELEAELAAAKGALGFRPGGPLRGGQAKGKTEVGSPEGARNPTCFSVAPPGLLHSTPSPVDRERSITLPAQLHRPHLPSLALQLTR